MELLDLGVSTQDLSSPITDLVNTSQPPRCLKLFSERRYVPEYMPHATLLCPFWGANPENPNAPDSGRYNLYIKTGQAFFELTLLESADVAVLPVDWNLVAHKPASAFEFAEKVRQAMKPLVVFFWSDSFAAVPLADAIVFRTSLHRSTQRPNEFAIPVWSEDFVCKYLSGKVPIRPKSTKPKVSFCGFAEPLNPSLTYRAVQLVQQGRAIAHGQHHERAAGLLGRAIRTEAMGYLLRNKGIDTDFIIRDHFWAGAAKPNVDPTVMRQARLDYLNNMLNSDYVLCVRGAGNFSFRLYETLCCGRIPLFVDTDCVLPYDFAVDWKKYCVWVDQQELPHIAEKLLDVHAHLSADEFASWQEECRTFWERWLSPTGFFSNFYRYFALNPM